MFSFNKKINKFWNCCICNYTFLISTTATVNAQQLPELTKLALITQQKNQSPHETVEQFFLINDGTTVCTELPVFINPKEIPSLRINTPITGHIDIIQIKYDKLYILDYKPNLRHPEHYISQLQLYKKAIHERTKIPEDNIIPAVFNEHAYIELK